MKVSTPPVEMILVREFKDRLKSLLVTSNNAQEGVKQDIAVVFSDDELQCLNLCFSAVLAENAGDAKELSRRNVGKIDAVLRLAAFLLALEKSG